MISFPEFWSAQRMHQELLQLADAQKQVRVLERDDDPGQVKI